MDRSMMYFGGIMGASFILVMVIQGLLPPEIGKQIGGVVFIGSIFGGILGIEVFYRLTTSEHPYIRALIRPDNELVNLFLDIDPHQERELGDGWYSDMLVFRWPVKTKNYGEIEQWRWRLIHRFPLNQRLKFLRGTATKDDYDFTHPATECIEVVQNATKETSIDHSDVIPEFKLLSARNDWNLVTTIASMIPTSNPGPILVQTNDPVTLQTQLAQEKAEKAYWHQIAISLQQWVDQQRDETRGLLDAKAGIKEFGLEYILTIYQAFGDLKKAIESQQGNRYVTIGKWIAVTVLGVLGILFVWSNPRIFDAIGAWVNNPQNQLSVLIAFLSVLIVIIYLIRRRSRSE